MSDTVSVLLAKTLSSTIFEQALIAIGTFGVIASAIFSCVYLSISPYVRGRGHRYLLWLGGQSNGGPERLDFLSSMATLDLRESVL